VFKNLARYDAHTLCIIFAKYKWSRKLLDSLFKTTQILMGSLYDIKVFKSTHAGIFFIFVSLLNLVFSKFPSWSAAQVVS
jgi:hypothetical protein